MWKMHSYVQAAGSLKIKNPALEKYVAILSKGKKKNLWVALLRIRNSCAQFEVVY